jgi:hypothetical protein
MKERKLMHSDAFLFHQEKNYGGDGIMLTLKEIMVIPEPYRQ